MDVLKYLKSIHLITLAQFQALFLKLQDNRNNRHCAYGSTAMRFDRHLNGGSTDYPDKIAISIQFNSKSFVAIPKVKLILNIFASYPLMLILITL